LSTAYWEGLWSSQEIELPAWMTFGASMNLMEKFLEDTDPQLESSNVLKKAVNNNNNNEKKLGFILVQIRTP